MPPPVVVAGNADAMLDRCVPAFDLVALRNDLACFDP